MAPRWRRALHELAPDVTPEESHEEVLPQGGVILVGSFNQFTDTLWTNFQ